ncbi:PH domain-containing protein [Salegentibacter salegens]|uniref:Putative membrane protein n=1 Tax=Salegentibacter salegens TaxID=143223 RepID=A0A1M7P244_9FLAO|nr:PH domain-containing protein [Salegentibacter salegens]PRX40515.1 putative membrane protein [Salegentibacter salegens]SHM24802.1 putative membrane protein [Salegentibacter salegens]SHN10229.1 putative membrane protein [Salegentibacter salegens]
MNPEAYSNAQRQSIAGILLIFISSLYKLFRTFWAVGAYLLVSGPSRNTLIYIGLGLLFIGILTFIYSYLYYRKFVFYIDYKREEFVLEKGIFSTENTAIPFDKIQQVYFKRSILQRIIKVYSLIIDTAGSNLKEVEIKAISGEDANKLSKILLKAKAKNTEENSIEESLETEDNNEVFWTHKVGFLTLLKIGISTNYLRGLSLVFAFVMTIYNRVNTYFKDRVEDVEVYFDQFSGVLQSIGFLALLFVLLLLLSISITIIEVFIKYYGLTIQQNKDKMEVEMGLKTNTKVSLQPRRLQLMRIKTNPVQKRFNLYEAQISLSSSENELQKNKIKIPGLGKEIVKKIKYFLYPESSKSSFSTTFRPDKLLLFRKISLAVLPVLIFLALWYFTDFIRLKLWAVLAVASLYMLAALSLQILAFRARKLIITEEFLQKKTGFWNKTEETLELFKIQSISVKQPIWYKRKNLVNVVFHTAGGDLNFYAVNRDILQYVNYVLYKAEVSSKNWM